MTQQPLRLLRGLALLLCLIALPLAAKAEGQDACFSTLVTGAIADVTVQGDIVLASGQRLSLADIALPDAEPWRQQALTFLKNLKGQPTTVDLGGKADRWNRVRAALAMPDGDLAELLLTRGLAIVDGGEARALCNGELLATERQARARRDGLWADAASHPLSTRDTEKLLERQGRFTLVSGRILSVGVREKWTYLNFGRDWQKDFSASISATVWARAVAKGLSAETLRGKTVLIRGIVRQWRGPSMEITAPDLLEVF